MRIELTHKGFADLSLTTWVPRPESGDEGLVTSQTRTPPSSARHLPLVTEVIGAGNGIRTRDFDLGKVALYH